MNDADRIQYWQNRIAKAKATINEIHNHIQFGYYNTAVNRIYYASFYAAQALLTTIDNFPKSHKGILIMLSEHFIRTKKIPLEFGEFYSKLFQEKIFADYGDESIYSKESIEKLLSEACQFIQHIESIKV